MSYTLTPYLVRVEQLRQAAGSRDTDLLRSLEARFGDVLHRYEDDGLGLGTALRQIVEGTQLDPQFGWVYGYALELLCKHFGQVVSAPELSELHLFAFDEIVPWMSPPRAPLELPAIGDFPVIGYVELAQLPALVEEWGASFYDRMDRHLVPACEALVDIYQRAIDQRADIVGFFA